MAKFFLESSNKYFRPALLRKDFLIDEYQIYEAKLYGADTLLLIVAAMQVLENLKQIPNARDHLLQMIEKARSLGMEPLVEVNNSEEMKIAIEVGSKVIGINNRNLHSFQVDLHTTTRLVEGESLPKDVILVALSGISTRSDVAFFENIGVKAILVGEALMRANNPREKIKELRGERLPVLVKICGVMDSHTALQVAESSADFIGLVFAESRRKLTIEKAKEIAEEIHKYRNQSQVSFSLEENQRPATNAETKEHLLSWSQSLGRIVTKTKPLIVGVFADNDLEYVNKVAQEVPLDIIQLSGHEGFAITNETILPTVKAIHVGSESSADNIVSSIGITIDKKNLAAVLLDTQDPNVKGGSGRAFDWTISRDLAQQIPFFLAGGLNPSNIVEAVKQSNPFAVDVSSGVETEGKKDLQKVKDFINRAKQ
jgi:anthranilate synthase/indole-3-glycerol phosphate synthase/phosphoribosylanthranilate isomerase